MARHGTYAAAVALAAACLVAGCGGGGSDSDLQAATYTVGGTVAGLGAGEATTLQLTVGGATRSALRVTGNGAFTFPQTVASGESYTITAVRADAAGVNCSVANGTGVAGGNVSNVSVGCLRVGGITSGLNGAVHLHLSVDGGDPITLRVDDDGVCTFDPATGTGSCPFGTAFGFRTRLAPGQSYAVTVASNPFGQDCSVTNGSGVMGSAHVSNIGVACITTGPIPPYFSVAGTASGMLSHMSLRLTVNGEDFGSDLFVNGIGGFTFPHRLTSGQTYSVLLAAPGNASCVIDASGVIMFANVTNAFIVCKFPVGTPGTFSVGGSVSGWTGGIFRLGMLVSGADFATDFNVTANGTFTLPYALVTGQSYAVVIRSQPLGQSCSVSNASGTMGSADVTSLSIVCH